MAGYSIVMRGFAGRHGAFADAAEKAFGRRGLSAFSLCSPTREHLPAEIAAGLSAEDAERARELLTAAGAVVEVFPTDAVEGVRHRADECWPSRFAGHWRFTEIDGMILILSPLNARENLEVIRARSPDLRPWRIERGMNHRHPSHDSSRQGLRIAQEFGEDLAAALKEAYPQRGFVISYLQEQVSFYQRGDGAPEADLPPKGEPRAVAFCEVCRHHRRYTRRPGTDAEFPWAEFGTCAECGAEVVIRTGEHLVCVGPYHARGEDTPPAE